MSEPDAEAIGIDVGGTKTVAVRTSIAGAVLARETRPTPAEDVDGTLSTIVEVARAVRTSGVVAAGVGAAGLVERPGGRMKFAPNLAWRELPLQEHLREELGVPVVVDNDATVAAWGELRFGAGRGYRHMLFVGVGTGIGGGIVADGRLFRGAHGFAAEIGHIVVEPGGPRCGCGNHGCLEQVASGHALVRAAREVARRSPESPIGRLAGSDPDRATGSVVTSAARQGDPEAIGILAEVGRRLGEGIGGLVNVLDPEVVVVGGGVAEAGELLLGPARASFADTVEGAAFRPPVPLVVAELGNDAGAVGAAALALDAVAPDATS